MSDLTLFFDGGGSHHGGFAGSGWVIVDTSGDVVAAGHRRHPVDTTNNVAEYVALIDGLDYCVKRGHKQIAVKGDSKLVIMQTLGLWKVKAVHLAQYRDAAQELLTKIQAELIWVPRAENSLADALATSARQLRDFDMHVKNPRSKKVRTEICVPEPETTESPCFSPLCACCNGHEWVISDLERQLEEVRAQLEEAQLRSIEARNPGIDMEEVKRLRGRRW